MCNSAVFLRSSGTLAMVLEAPLEGACGVSRVVQECIGFWVSQNQGTLIGSPHDKTAVFGRYIRVPLIYGN